MVRSICQFCLSIKASGGRRTKSESIASISKYTCVDESISFVSVEYRKQHSSMLSRLIGYFRKDDRKPFIRRNNKLYQLSDGTKVDGIGLKP